MFIGYDAQDFDIDRVPDLYGVFGLLHRLPGEFGNVDQAFQSMLKLDEGAKFGKAQDLGLYYLAGFIEIGRIYPGSGCNSFSPRETFLFTRSTPSTKTSISSPVLRTSEGCLTLFQDSSER